MSSDKMDAGEKVMGQISREMRWDEMTDMQKIQRLREEVQMLASALTAFATDVRQLRSHSHTHDGTIVVPMRGDIYEVGRRYDRLS
jgi:hypothetical protein